MYTNYCSSSTKRITHTYTHTHTHTTAWKKPEEKVHIVKFQLVYKFQKQDSLYFSEFCKITDPTSSLHVWWLHHRGMVHSPNLYHELLFSTQGKWFIPFLIENCPCDSLPFGYSLLSHHYSVKEPCGKSGAKNNWSLAT